MTLRERLKDCEKELTCGPGIKGSTFEGKKRQLIWYKVIDKSQKRKVHHSHVIIVTGKGNESHSV